MCTISCASDQFKVILEALSYFNNESGHQLALLDPDDFGSFYERVWCNRYELSKDLLEKLSKDFLKDTEFDLPF